MDGQLTDLEGIGPARAEQLAEQGIGSVEELAAADPDVVARGIPGVSVWTAAEWVQKARMGLSPENPSPSRSSEGPSPQPSPRGGEGAARQEAVSVAAKGREVATGVGQPDDEIPRQARNDDRGLDPLRGLYERGTWRGKPQWKCKVCPFDTLKGEEVIREHVARVHVLQSREVREAGGEILIARR